LATRCAIFSTQDLASRRDCKRALNQTVIARAKGTTHGLEFDMHEALRFAQNGKRYHAFTLL
jgi:hypothetical protein